MHWPARGGCAPHGRLAVRARRQDGTFVQRLVWEVVYNDCVDALTCGQTAAAAQMLALSEVGESVLRSAIVGRRDAAEVGLRWHCHVFSITSVDYSMHAVSCWSAPAAVSVLSGRRTNVVCARPYPRASNVAAAAGDAVQGLFTSNSRCCVQLFPH